MNTIRPHKALVKIFYVLQDPEGNIIREIPGPDAALFHPMPEQLENLIYAWMEKLQDDLAQAGTPVRMPNNGKKLVSNGKSEEPRERPGLQLRHPVREAPRPGGGQGST